MRQPFWFRELFAGEKGPDWMFNAAFAPGSNSPAEVAREHTPLGFTYYQATQRPCPIHWNSKACDYDLYVDTPHYQACIDQLEGRQEHTCISITPSKCASMRISLCVAMVATPASTAAQKPT